MLKSFCRLLMMCLYFMGFIWYFSMKTFVKKKEYPSEVDFISCKEQGIFTVLLDCLLSLHISEDRYLVFVY
jgi:hypothetical protein